MGEPHQRRLAVWAVVAALAALPAGAGETDQYLAWGVSLADASPPLNRYVNQAIETTLAGVNRSGGERLECADLPPKIYRYLFQGLLSSRLRHFLDEDPSVDRHPGPEVSYFSYFKSSVLRGPAFPFLMPMSRTIEIDGVHLGIDKINHIFGFGRRYYVHYRRYLRRGHGEEEALRRAIAWGFRVERYLVGGWTDGILSFADLEANYQGLRLARELCEAEPPHLARGDGGWRLARPVDIRRYVNPRLDESYNENRYSRWRWRSVRRVLEREVCPRLAEPAVQARWAAYRRVDVPSRSERILAEHLAEIGLERPADQSLLAVCPPELVRLLDPAGHPVLAGR